MLKVDETLQRKLAARIAGGDESTKPGLLLAVGDEKYKQLVDDAKDKKDGKKRASEAEKKPLAKKLDTKSNEVHVWLNTINLGQYADEIIKLGLDTLNELKENVDDITEDNDDFEFMAKYHLKKLFKGVKELCALTALASPAVTTAAQSSTAFATSARTAAASAAAASATPTSASTAGADTPTTAAASTTLAGGSAQLEYTVDYSKVDISKYDEWTGGYKFDKRGDPCQQMDAYTFQKKIICGVIDPKMTPTDSTAIFIFSNHRQIGKSKLLQYLVKSGYAVFVDGVDWKADKKTVAEAMQPDPNGETLFQKRPMLAVNLRAADKRLDKKELYDSVEEYTDGGLGLLPNGWEEGVNPLYIFVGNNPPKIGEGEPGGDLSSSRLNVYEIEGVGEPFQDEEGQPRYHDYDLVISSVMFDKAKAKGVAKFQIADYSKKAREAGVALDVYIFFDMFVAFVPTPKRDPTMMPGKDMAKILRDKNECFKPFLSGNGPQFEMAKFHQWLRDNGELLTPPGLKPVKFKLNGGSLGEMVIVHTYPSREAHYSLKPK